MKNVTLLGAGLVGKAIAMDLKKHVHLHVLDSREDEILFLKAQGISAEKCNVTDAEALQKAIRQADLVVGAVPGAIGFQTAQTVIESGKNLVDISFFPEDALKLDALAKEKNVIALVDCGIAPGISNLVAGYHAAHMSIHTFACYVGGLPQIRTLPYEYKAPFSPRDVVEEYTRPARLIEDGNIVTKPALSDAELLDVPGIGTLEAFNTDGLRTLLTTVAAKNMFEKTLRYPGHRERIQLLKDSGFFSESPIEVEGAAIRPLDVTAQLLMHQWRIDPHEPELTVMRMEVIGDDKIIRYDMLDRYEPSTETTSMARTTGYTCTAMASLVLDGSYQEIGVSPPEKLGESETCFTRVFEHLAHRGVIFEKTVKSI